MFLTLCVFAGVLAFLPGTHSYSCGNIEFCFPDDYQEAYCCGLNDERCCYYTNVAYLWWFWVILVVSILFFCICITSICRARRQRVGYVVVRGETYVPNTTVVHTHQSGQVAASAAYPQYGAAYPAYQGYNQKPAETAYGYPPPYAPPPPQQHEPQQPKY